MLELTQWWRQAGLDSKPWMILGKGPSFGEHTRVDLTQFHLLSLNHAVQKLSVDVAHLIDLDVVEDCGEALLTNCRWLLMPRYPHVKFQASPQPLEAHVARSSVLQRLAEDFHPAHLVRRSLFADAREQCDSARGAPRARAEALGAFRLLGERLAQLLQRPRERLQRVRESRFARRLGPTKANPFS